MRDWTSRSIQAADAEAPKWDQQNEAWLEGPRADMLQFFYRFVPDRGSRVLDMGCGPGESTRLMLERGYRAVGADQSAKMIDAAVRRGVEGYVTDGDPLPFEDGSFDAVFVCTVLEWTESPHRQVKELVRVLKPGGRVVAVALGPLARPRWAGYPRLYGEPVIHNMMMPWELHKLLLDHGLTCDAMEGTSALGSPYEHVRDALSQDWRAQAALSFLWGFGMVKG